MKTNLETEIDKLSIGQVGMQKDIGRILFFLDNDDGTGQKGLVSQVSLLKQDFDDFKIEYGLKEKARDTRQTIFGAIGGSIVTGVMWATERFIH